MVPRRRLELPRPCGPITDKRVAASRHIYDSVKENGAQEKTRTSTALRPLAPEASASTNSATWAPIGFPLKRGVHVHYDVMPVNDLIQILSVKLSQTGAQI